MKGMTNRKNRFLRFLIIEDAWIAVRQDSALLITFERLMKKIPKTRAIIHIAGNS